MPSALLCRPRLVRLALLIGCASLAACSPKPPQDLPPAPEAPSVTSNSPAPMLRGPMPGSEADFMASMAGQDVIHFALDKYNIDPVSAAALQSQSQWLVRYPSKHVTIEGHCDERGTRDYNLALGERRANAAKNYLTSLGIDAGRISTISYGKERPIAMGSNEDAWARNRRGVTVVID